MSAFHAVNGETVVAAMKIYDARYPNNDYNSWLTNGSFTHAVCFNQRLYPPKYLIELVTGVPSANFHTQEAIPLLQKYGFFVGSKEELKARIVHFLEEAVPYEQTEQRQQVREILNRIGQNPIVPTPGTPDSVELLREDRNR